MMSVKCYPFFFISLLLGSLSIRAQDNYPHLSEISGLEVGTRVANFQAIDQEGKTFDLQDALSKGPVVLLFYRGQWCPVCNRHLSNLRDSLKFIRETGAITVAISPEKPDLLRETAQKTQANFRLLHDEDYRICQQFDVLFKPESSSIRLYNKALNAQLKKAHSDESMRLPVPATFIINQKGEVIWRHFDPDYKKRAGVDKILEALQKA